MVSKKVEKILLYILLGSIGVGVIIGIGAFLWAEISVLPPSFYTDEDVITTFETRMNEIDELLEQYGLQNVAKQDSCLYVVNLGQDEYMHIRLCDYDAPLDPPHFLLSLLGQGQDDPQKCVLDFEEHPYFFEIAGILSANHFSAERYKNLCYSAKKVTEKSLEEGVLYGGSVGMTYMRTAFFKLGEINYYNAIEQEHYYPTTTIYMRLY